MITTDELKDIIEEFDNLMQAGLDELAVNDKELAEEYFSDAAHVLSKVQDKRWHDELATKYTVNPLDFAN